MKSRVHILIRDDNSIVGKREWLKPEPASDDGLDIIEADDILPDDDIEIELF